MRIVEEADSVLVEVLPEVVVLDEERPADEAAVEGLDNKGPEANFEVVSVKYLVYFTIRRQQCFTIPKARHLLSPLLWARKTSLPSRAGRRQSLMLSCWA